VCSRPVGAAREGRKEKPKPERKKKQKAMDRGGRKLVKSLLKIIENYKV
jgi:hypothetical protein